MSNEFTLDEINEAAEEQFGSLVIPLPPGKVRLLNPIRLSEAKRNELFGLVKKDGVEEKSESEGQPEEESEAEAEEKLNEVLSQIDKFRQILRLAAETEQQATWLINALGDDLAKYLIVVRQYFNKEKAGKASQSQD